MKSILIKNGLVWNGDNFAKSDVLVKNGIISDIRTNIQEEMSYVYDATSQIVSCGLIDVHTHLAGISLPQFGVQPELSSIPFGVTSVADASGYFGNKNTLDSFTVKTAVFVCAGIQNNIASFEAALKKLSDFQDKVVGIKVYFDDSNSSIRDITPLKSVCDFARKHNIIVIVHSSNSPVPMADIAEVLERGDIITHAYHGGKNSIDKDYFAAYKLAREKGIIIDMGMAGNVHFDFNVFAQAAKFGYFPDTISTDVTRLSSYVRGGRYGMTLCMSVAKHFGMSDKDIFQAVTSTAARVLHREHEWGYLEKGRKADISVFEFKDAGFSFGEVCKSESGFRCKMTIIDGQIMYVD